MSVAIEKDMTAHLHDAFSWLPHVSSVDVRRWHEEYTVNIAVRDFSRSVREPIYRRQRELLKEFKDLSLRFHILDESTEIPAPDATFTE